MNTELISIMKTQGAIQAQMARMALERAGIPCFVRNDLIQNLGFWSFLPDCELEIQVPGPYAEESVRLLNKELEETSDESNFETQDVVDEPVSDKLAAWFYDYGDFSRARKCFQRLCEKNPGDADAYYNLACCCVKLDLLEEARESLVKAFERAAAHRSDSLRDSDLAPLHEWIKSIDG